MKKNLFIIIGVTIIMLVFSLLIFGVKKATNKYTYENQYIFVCVNINNCDYEEVDELMPPLKNHLLRQDNINKIVDNVNKKINYRISSNDVKSTIKIKQNKELIQITVKHKDTKIAYLINHSLNHTIIPMFESDRKVDIYKVDENFIQGPKLVNHLSFGLTAGIMISLVIIATDLKINLKLKKEKKEN